MRVISQTTLSLVIDGEDLHWALVRQPIWRTRAQDGRPLQGLLALPAPAREAALRQLPQADRIVLTVPPDWCMIAPIDLTLDQWRRSKTQISESLDRLLPIEADQALLGLIERAGAEDDGPGSYLLALRLSQAQPWIDAIESALGRPIDMILAQQMALSGALRHEEDAVVVGHRAGGRNECVTVVRRGAVERVIPGAPRGELDSMQAARYDLKEGRLHVVSGASASSHEQLPGPRPISLAVCATSAPRAAPRHLAPFRGVCPRPAPTWLAPVLALMLSGGLLALSSWADGWRYEAAMASIDRASEATRDQVTLVEHDRAQHERVARLINEEVVARTARWRPVLPEVEAIQQALPQGAFLYRIRIDATSLSLRGEAPRASDVLERFDGHPHFNNVRTIDAPVVVEERGLEQFHIRVERAHPAVEGAS